jgi:hypothetical protein
MLEYKIERAFQLLFGSLAVPAYVGMGGEVLELPRNVVSAQAQEENPYGSGNYVVQVQIEMASDADLGAATLAAQVDGVTDWVFGGTNRSGEYVMHGTLAEALSAAVPDFHVFGVYNHRSIPVQRHDRTIVAGIEALVYSCEKDIT